MKVAFFYLCAFVALLGGIAATASGDYISAVFLFALFLGLPLLAKVAA